MSRSNPRKGSSNPAKKFIEFKNQEFTYWDKELEENVAIPLPFEFIVLDELATVTGYHKPSNSGIYSNEVRSVKDDTLTVKTFKGKEPLIAEGHWKDIKDVVDKAGGRFTRTVYALLDSNGSYELVLFKFAGATFSEWLDFSGDNRKALYGKSAAKVTDLSKERKNGSVKYKVPIFEVGSDLHDTDLDTAFTEDQKLQRYLDGYFGKSEEAAAEAEEEVEEDLVEV